MTKIISRLAALFSITLIVFSLNNSFAQLELPEDKVSWTFRIEQTGCEATLIGEFKIVDKWHIYAANLPKDNMAIPTNIELSKSPNFKVVGKIIEPKPHFEHDAMADEDLYYHSGKIIMKRKLQILSNKNFVLKGVFSYQTCDDAHCLPPFDAEFTVNVSGCKDLAVSGSENIDSNLTENATNGSANLKNENTYLNEINKVENTTADTTIGNSASEKPVSLWVTFFLAFLSGFAALLTPCVFPMIPLTVSFFTKQSKTRAAGIRNAMFYGFSIIIIYVLLGTIITKVFGSDALNALSTNVYFNIIFFILLVVFAVSFMGAFEIRLPSSWANKADRASDKGGFIGIFFMALALAIVSFSCTGPIVGTLLVQSAVYGGIGPFVGMLGFSLALALPFTLFAAFPGWMNTLPKSGGWLNTVKVFLGFLELALAFKFLSNADLVVQAHLLEREVFLAIWIGIFSVLALYLFGKIRLPHDSPLEFLSVGRTLLGVLTLIFVIYLIPGMWGAPLKIISGFPPPMNYSESPLGVGGSGVTTSDSGPKGSHLGPQNIMVFDDLDLGMAYAKEVNKPIFLDFTGHACVNCRKMEENVWGKPGVIDILKQDVVIISLHVDDKRELPISEQKTVTLAGKKRKLVTIGNKWSHFQATTYKTNTQPYYRMLDSQGNDLSNGSADYEHHGNAQDFLTWLKEGMNSVK